ncbi:MAG: cytochrome c oxidase subunit 3 [Spirochaetes bacterium]|nr:cytochrome c oxidase subunit 3 [Spirochaetota bacterium]
MNDTDIQSRDGGRIGMWLFIATEILLFGGLFLLYSMYRYRHAGDFHAASLELSRVFGTLNTGVLITSSLFAALAVHWFDDNKRDRATYFLWLTSAMGLVFLGVKAVEWSIKFHHGTYPSSPELLARSKGIILYYGLYFMMTGLHALHVIIGVVVLTVMGVRIRRGLPAARSVLVGNSALYWHLVDVIWIFLFPLFYLIT